MDDDYLIAMREKDVDDFRLWIEAIEHGVWTSQLPGANSIETVLESLKVKLADAEEHLRHLKARKAGQDA